MRKSSRFGSFFKEKRIEKGYTLREFCEKYGLDPGNMSKLERGLLPPPASRQKLEQLASYLGLKEGTDDWMEFFDLAAATRGEFPKDVLDNDKIVEALPLIFRTIRGKKVSEKLLDDLVEKIRMV